MGRKQFTISNFYCLDCGNEIALPRNRGHQREKNHIKHIYCICCKAETKHLEKREKDFDLDLSFLNIKKPVSVNA